MNYGGENTNKIIMENYDTAEIYINLKLGTS